MAKAKLLKKEQDILYSAIDAFTATILAREKLSINRRNLNLLIKQVENDKVRLDRGQITITDLSQSESSLAGAQAQFTQASSDLLISKLNYENIIGKIADPKKLRKSAKAIVSVPDSLSKAIELSKKNDPDIIIAKLELNQSEKDLEISEADLKPTASLSLERSYTEDLSTTYDEREKDILKATVSWPFYSGGKKIATISKNQSLKNKKTRTIGVIVPEISHFFFSAVIDKLIFISFAIIYLFVILLPYLRFLCYFLYKFLFQTLPNCNVEQIAVNNDLI